MSENIVTCQTFGLNSGQAAAETCHLKGYLLNLKLVFLRKCIIPSSYSQYIYSSYISNLHDSIITSLCVKIPLLKTKMNKIMQSSLLVDGQDYNLHQGRSEPRSSGNIFTDSSGGLFSFSSPVGSHSAISPSILASEQITPTIGVSIFSGGRSPMAARPWSTRFSSRKGQEISSHIPSRISAAGTLKIAGTGHMFTCVRSRHFHTGGSAENCCFSDCSLQFIYFGQQLVAVLKMISETCLCKLEQEGVKLNILRDISMSHSKNWNHISLQIAE